MAAIGNLNRNYNHLGDLENFIQAIARGKVYIGIYSIFPMQNLVDRYENKRVLVNSQLKALFNLLSISKESGSFIKSLQGMINDCITNLSLLSIGTQNWDVIFAYICSTKLPEHTLGL